MGFWNCLRMIGLFYIFIVILMDKAVSVALKTVFAIGRSPSVSRCAETDADTAGCGLEH